MVKILSEKDNDFKKEFNGYKNGSAANMVRMLELLILGDHNTQQILDKCGQAESLKSRETRGDVGVVDPSNIQPPITVEPAKIEICTMQYLLH